MRLLDVSKLRKIGPFHDALCDREYVFALSEYQWNNVDSNDWREYCMNPKSFTWGSKPSATTKAAPTMLRDSFAKSIKKDPEAYPAFKEAQFWDTWNRKLQSKAHLHDLSNVLDFSYLPATAEENELFELQKRFMYSVFLSKITVADGAHIVKLMLRNVMRRWSIGFCIHRKLLWMPIQSERKSML